MLKIIWEIVDQEGHAGHMFRSKVPGGWLVKEVDDVLTPTAGDRMDSGYEWRTALCFVPDADHLWLKPEESVTYPQKIIDAMFQLNMSQKR